MTAVYIHCLCLLCFSGTLNIPIGMGDFFQNSSKKIQKNFIVIVRLNDYNKDVSLYEEAFAMEYMSVQQAAKKWGISERRVQILCCENRIPNLSKLGRMWLIPQNSEKPIDKRTRQGKEKKNEKL